MLAATGYTHLLFIVPYKCFFACIGRPEASIAFLDQQRDFFNEKKVGVEAARRFLVPDEIQDDNSEKARLGVESVLVEEVDGNEEKETNAEEVYNEVEEEMDDDVSRNDSLYDTEQDVGKVAHSAVEMLLFIVVNAGLLVTWYARKLQRKRSGFHKNR
jgi:hypothetical protein